MRIRRALLGGLVLLAVGVAAVLALRRPAGDGGAAGPIVIGLLSSGDAPQLAAAGLAVDELNRGAGLLGRRVALRVEDARAGAGEAARRLIVEGRAVALFGCGTSDCRQQVRPVVEAQRHLLFYPMAHEGMERSAHIVYTGPTPNQQVLPATDWAMGGFGRRVYLVGTEGPFLRGVHAVLRDFIPLHGGQVLGERHVPPDSPDMAAVVTDLRRMRPALVLSTLRGASNQAFFDALVAAELGDVPLLSFVASEPELRAYGGGRLDLHFTAWSYLQSLPGPANAAFLARLRALNGPDAQASDPAVAIYVAVHLWAAAVRELGGLQTEAVNASVLQQVVEAPDGFAAPDAQTRRLWRPLRIAQVRPDGQLTEVWRTSAPIRPSVWPTYRSLEHWRGLMAAYAEQRR
ncbi:transporter substrate-binding protein [Roseateles sp. DXS20W]|uniref:Transporter substrate-binding protein n=1 Tax=Pelomonas lactea TaxID=3299030 RepID=A0ABW7GGU6_9BURK